MAQEIKVRRSVRATITIGAVGLLLMGFQNCSEVQFNENPALEVTSVENRSVSLFFDKKYSDDDSNVDIVWLIDNSTSMTEETEIIRKNLKNLLNKIETRSNLKFTVISSDDQDYGVSLSESDLEKGYVQITRKQHLGKALDEILRHTPGLISSNLIREKSQKVIIFSGDTDFTSGEGRISNEQFLERISEIIKIEDLTFYNFVGLPSSQNCNISNPALRAIQLADITGGDSYDICKEDWSNSFNSILKNIARLAKTEFTLPSKPNSNLQVRVNGVLTDRYVVEDLSLILDPTNFPEEANYRIQVDYER